MLSIVSCASQALNERASRRPRFCAQSHQRARDVVPVGCSFRLPEAPAFLLLCIQSRRSLFYHRWIGFTSRIPGYKCEAKRAKREMKRAAHLALEIGTGLV